MYNNLLYILYIIYYIYYIYYILYIYISFIWTHNTTSCNSDVSWLGSTFGWIQPRVCLQGMVPFGEFTAILASRFMAITARKKRRSHHKGVLRTGWKEITTVGTSWFEGTLNGQMHQECQKKMEEGAPADELCAEPQASWRAMERQRWQWALQQGRPVKQAMILRLISMCVCTSRIIQSQNFWHHGIHESWDKDSFSYIYILLLYIYIYVTCILNTHLRVAWDRLFPQQTK